MLFEIVRKCAHLYLDHKNPAIRREAAKSITTLLAQDEICNQSSNHSMQIVSDILERLLDVGVTDSDVGIRKCVLDSLNECFDHHLAQAEYIACLFKSLNDEEFPIRDKAVAIIVRLIPLNPAHVLPALRKTLIQLLTELEFSSIAQQREDAASLLLHLVPRLARLIQPYIDPILQGSFESNP